MKVIRINTPKGQYDVPLKNVAYHRADYYTDPNDKSSDDYIDEVNLVMLDDYEGIDWLVNNTDWEDWLEVATKVNDSVKVTEDDFWTDSEDFKIVDLDD
jgi:enolase